MGASVSGRLPKKCVCATRPKNAENFNRNKAQRSGWQNQCKFCAQKYSRVRQRSKKGKEGAQKTYMRYREAILAKNKARGDKNAIAWRALIKERGLDYCSKCGYNKCFAAIEFHHPDPNGKHKPIGYYTRRRISEAGLQELSRTIPLCSNCHREEHFNPKQGD